MLVAFDVVGINAIDRNGQGERRLGRVGLIDCDVSCEVVEPTVDVADSDVRDHE